MGRNFLTVDGTNLSDFGVYISGQGTFGSPEKEYTYYEVPAKDGDDIGSSSRLKNVEVTYPAFIYSNFTENMGRLRSFLLSRKGYVRISDTYHPDEFRLATFEEAIVPDVTPRNDAGQFDLVFNCKPQRYLVSGEEVVTLNIPSNYSQASMHITNPTEFGAKPFIRVYGTGIVNVYAVAGDMSHSVTITIADFNTVYPSIEYTDIDCETMNCYNGNRNLCAYVSFRQYNASVYGVDAPWLVPGSNGVSVPSQSNSQATRKITKVEVTPRFWRV